jgi:hypothetical protein
VPGTAGCFVVCVVAASCSMCIAPCPFVFVFCSVNLLLLLQSPKRRPLGSV